MWIRGLDRIERRVDFPVSAARRPRESASPSSKSAGLVRSRCYHGRCVNGICRSCAVRCAAGTGNSGDLCCDYPQVPLCQPASSRGNLFVRCFTPGIDGAGDPNGPSAAAGATPSYDQGAPKVRTPR